MAASKARITVEVERHLLRRVKAKAALRDMTISDVVRTALSHFLAEETATSVPPEHELSANGQIDIRPF